MALKETGNFECDHIILLLEFLLQKHSNILEDLDRVILNLIAFGILDKLFRSYDFKAANEGEVSILSTIYERLFSTKVFCAAFP